MACIKPLLKAASAVANDMLEIAENSHTEPYHGGWNETVWKHHDPDSYKLWKRLTDQIIEHGGKPEPIKPKKPKERSW